MEWKVEDEVLKSNDESVGDRPGASLAYPLGVGQVLREYTC